MQFGFSSSGVLVVTLLLNVIVLIMTLLMMMIHNGALSLGSVVLKVPGPGACCE